MPYTNQPATVPQDAVMSYVGDTDTGNQLLTDAQYAGFLGDTGGSIGKAAHRAALALEAKYASLADKTVGPVKIAYSQVSRSYHDLAANLLASASEDGIGIPIAIAIAGGITDPNTGCDIVPFFTRTTP